jgi:four helix bundle protein
MAPRATSDLLVWQAARKLAADVYTVTGESPFADDPELKSQLRSTATSIMTSVAAGYERKACGGFREALTRAVHTAAELESLLVLGEDLRYLSSDRAADLRTSVGEVRRHLETLRNLVARYELAKVMMRPETVN